MSRKNLIIGGIVAGLLILVLIIVFALGSSSNTGSKKKSGGNFTVWIVGDSGENFSLFLNDFKKDAGYKNLATVVESFSDYGTYSKALSKALISGKGPDVFVMNNNEKPFFEDNVLALDPKRFSPNKFRNNLEGFFADDLLYSDGEKDKKIDFAIGVPVGFESLGIFYNKQKGVKSVNLENWAKLSSHIDELAKRKPGIIPLGIGNGTTTKFASDILTQFFMLNEFNDISQVSAKIKQSLGQYFLSQTNNGVNLYNIKSRNLKFNGENNLNLFSKGDVAMVIGYPRMLLDIDKNGIRKNLLEAKPFPGYFNDKGNMLVNYNYFVVNKDSKKSDLSFELLEYMMSDNGAKNYLKQFPYYMPALRSLVSEKSEELILDGYRITLGNFYNPNLAFSSFNKGIKSEYDNKITELLDDKLSAEKTLDKVVGKILCKSKKIYKQENLSQKCN